MQKGADGPQAERIYIQLGEISIPKANRLKKVVEGEKMGYPNNDNDKCRGSRVVP